MFWDLYFIVFNFNRKSFRELLKCIWNVTSSTMCPKPATFLHKLQLFFSFVFKHSEQELVCKMELRLLVMSYGCFSDKIWLSGTNGCFNLILLVQLNIVELKQGNSCILPQFEAIWIINFSICILPVDISGVISSGEEERTQSWRLGTVHLAVECQIKVKLWNKRPLDLVSLMRPGKDALCASLVWQGEGATRFFCSRGKGWIWHSSDVRTSITFLTDDVDFNCTQGRRASHQLLRDIEIDEAICWHYQSQLCAWLQLQ